MLTFGACRVVTGIEMIENVREPGVHDVALVDESAMLHHGSRRMVVRQSEGNDSLEVQLLESNPQRSLGHFGREALAPLRRSDGIGELDFWLAFDDRLLDPAITDEIAGAVRIEDPQ